MKKHLLSLMVTTLVALAGGCTNNHGPDPDAAAANPVELPVNSFMRQWADNLKATGPITAVHVRDTYLFAYSQTGESYVMDRESGQILHLDRPRGGARRLHPPVVLKDRIVYPTVSSLEVYDLAGTWIKNDPNASGGRSQDLGFAIRSNAVGAKNTVFFGADFEGGGRLAAVDITQPYVPSTWQLMRERTAVSAAPALLNDAVYMGAEDGDVAAVSVETREPLWTLPNLVFATGAAIVADLAADETGVYVASTDTKLYCLQKTNGKVKWQYFGGAPLREGPVVTKELVYQHVPGIGMAALDKGEIGDKDHPTYNRTPRWMIADATQFLAQDDTYAYLRGSDNSIMAIDKSNGQTAFRSKRSDFVAFGTNTKDATIYAATRAGRLLAIKAVRQPGKIGELVLAPEPMRPEPLAMAR